MIFGRHETFYLREGWLYKIINEMLKKNHNIFSKKEAAEIFGVGYNMVPAMKYWGEGMGIIKHKREGTKNNYYLTKLGKIINEKDPHLEMIETNWLLHIKLVSKIEHSTLWYWLFNIYENDVLITDDYVLMITNWIIENEGKAVAEKTLMRDLLCLIQTYTREMKSYDLEDNLICPLSSLGLIERFGGKIIIKRVNEIDIPISIFEYVLFEYIKNRGFNDLIYQINIRDLLLDINSPGRILRCDSNGLIALLSRINGGGRKSIFFDNVRIVTTAGLDNVEITMGTNTNQIKENGFYNIYGESMK